MLRTKSLLCLLLSLALTLLTGCSGTGGVYSNYRDIEELLLVETMGLDFDEDGVTLSVSSGNSPANPSSSVISCRAASISAAMEQIQNYTAKEEFFYGHTRYVILGETTAENALETIMDFIERSPEMRMDTALFVLKDAKASDLMTKATNSQYELTKLLSSMERELDIIGNGRVFTCAEIAQSLATSGSALVSAISMEQTKDTVFSTDNTTIALPDGYAFLKDGTLRGFLDTDLAVGVNILQNHLGRTTLNLTDPNGKPVTVQLSTAEPTISPVWTKDGVLEAISVSLDATAAVIELAAEDHLYDEAFLKKLDKELARILEARICNVLLASRTFGADFLELGKTIRMQDPVRFDSMQTPWRELLPKLSFRLSVKAKLDRTYSITDPANTKGGGVSNAET